MGFFLNLYILNGQSASDEFLGKTFNQREYQLCKNQENQVFLIGKNDFFSLNSNKVHQYSQPVDSLFKQMNLSSLQWVAANNKIYLTSSSGGYLFEFNEKGIKRIDNSSIERAYYSSAFFTNDNKLYKLGGYGFWEFKSQLLKFDFTLKDWVLQDTLLDDNLGFIDPIVSTTDNFIYIVSPTIQNNFLGTIKANDYILKYDLNTKKIKKNRFDFRKYENYFLNKQYQKSQLSNTEKVGVLNAFNPINFALFDFEKNTVQNAYLDSPLYPEFSPVISGDQIYSLSSVKSNPQNLFLVQASIIKYQDPSSLTSYLDYIPLSLVFIFLLLVLVFVIFKLRSQLVLGNRFIKKGYKKIKIDYDEFYFLDKLVKDKKVENQDLISYFDRDGKSYDLNVKRKNAMISRLAFKIQTHFRIEIFEKVASPVDKRQGIYLLTKKLTLLEK